MMRIMLLYTFRKLLQNIIMFEFTYAIYIFDGYMNFIFYIYVLRYMC